MVVGLRHRTFMERLLAPMSEYGVSVASFMACGAGTKSGGQNWGSARRGK